MANAFGNDPNSSLAAALQTGAGFAQGGVGAAQGGVNAVLAGGGTIHADTGSMRNQARLVNTQAGAVNAEADALKALIPQLDPYKDRLTNYGDDLAALAAVIQGRADDVFGQAGALTSLDPNAGGLAGEYMAYYNLLSPERYVSRYASDAQMAIDNTRAQNERNLARRGVNIGSGANAGLANNLQRIKEAAVLAAAKSLGYDKGVTERGNWIKEMTSAAKTFYDMGTEQQGQALTAKGMAGDMAKGAAGIVTAQGGMLKDVGAMRAQVGELYANAASIFGNAASVETNYLRLTNNAYKMLADAYNSAAQYYLGAAGTEVSANNGGRGGGGGGGGGARVATATEEPAATGAWVDLTHGKASHKNGAEWVWDPNAPAAPAGE